MLGMVASPSKTVKRPCATLRETAVPGSLPLLLVPSLLQKVTVALLFTSTNLNWPVPLKLAPFAVTRPW